MCKKLGILAAVAVVGTLVVSQTRLASYVGTAWNRITVKAHKQVSPEFQIERARFLAGKLTNDIETQKGVVADETVKLNELTRSVETARKNVERRRDELAAVRGQIDGGEVKVSLNDKRTVPAGEAEKELAREYKTWTLMDDELKSREKLLSVQKQKKDLAEQQLNTLFSKKRELEVRIAQAEARLSELRMQQARTNSVRGDNTLAEVNELLGDLERETELENVKAQLDQQYNTKPAGTEPAVSADEMREWLGVTKPSKVVRGE